MKEDITELASLCKLAGEVERKWDQAGNEFLRTRMKRAEYASVVQEYLEAVRCLEAALCRHLDAMNAVVGLKTETQNPRKSQKSP